MQLLNQFLRPPSSSSNYWHEWRHFQGLAHKELHFVFGRKQNLNCIAYNDYIKRNKLSSED